MQFDRVRMILRARNGSQIPKYQNAPGKLPTPTTPAPSDSTLNSLDLEPVLDENGEPVKNPDGTIKYQKKQKKQNLLQQAGQGIKQAGKDIGQGFTDMINSPDKGLDILGAGLAGAGAASGNKDLSNAGALAGAAGDIVGGFQTGNPYGAISKGMDVVENIFFDKVENSATMDAVYGGLDAASNAAMMFNPAAGMAIKGAAFVMKGIDSAFGKKADTFTKDTETAEKVGGSYADSMADVDEAASLSGKKYGAFSGSSRRKANAKIREAKRQQSIMQDISEDTTLRRNLATNMADVNALRYSNALSGGAQPLRAARHGMKLSSRIEFVKSKRLGNLVINVDTRKIEQHKEGGVLETTIDWQPIIEDWSPIIEYKEGGTIDWQPIIEYQNGGKTRSIEELIEDAKQKNPRFIQRLLEPARGIPLEDGNYGSHLMTWNTDDEGAIVYPEIQEIDGELVHIKDNPLRRAFDNKNVLFMSPEEAELFTKEYKKYFPKFFKEFQEKYNPSDNLPDYREPQYKRETQHKFKEGGKTQEESPEIEETNQKNIIPEGALHKNKHHIENSEGLTQKGIPVIDNEGNQQAEIEKEEIILTLELTKTMEDMYKEFYSEETSKAEKERIATEAGKILVQQLLYNTEDRADLIKRCEEGGKL